jgi:hypothetical protein
VNDIARRGGNSNLGKAGSSSGMRDIDGVSVSGIVLKRNMRLDTERRGRGNSDDQLYAEYLEAHRRPVSL